MYLSLKASVAYNENTHMWRMRSPSVIIFSLKASFSSACKWRRTRTKCAPNRIIWGSPWGLVKITISRIRHVKLQILTPTLWVHKKLIGVTKLTYVQASKSITAILYSWKNHYLRFKKRIWYKCPFILLLHQPYIAIKSYFI